MNRNNLHYEIDVLDGHQNFVLEGCFLGTNPTGTRVLNPFYGGVQFHQDHQNGRVGGTTPAARNLLAVKNGTSGALLGSGPPGFVNGLVAGNLIGTDITGRLDLNTSSGPGINMNGGSNTVIGGTSPDARNVINGGIVVGSATGNFIQGDFIGTDVSGTVEFYCGNECIRISDQNNTIGGSAPGAGNRIGGGSQNGVGIRLQPTAPERSSRATQSAPTRPGSPASTSRGTAFSSTRWRAAASRSAASIPGRETSSPTARSRAWGSRTGDRDDPRQLDLRQSRHATGQRPRHRPLHQQHQRRDVNDPGDTDTGPNGFQNYPLITSVVYGASSTTVNGTLSSAPSTIYDVDFYGNPACARRPQDVPEARIFLERTRSRPTDPARRLSASSCRSWSKTDPP